MTTVPRTTNQSDYNAARVFKYLRDALCMIEDLTELEMEAVEASLSVLLKGDNQAQCVVADIYNLLDCVKEDWV